MQNPFRLGERVYLRPLESDDLPSLQRWFNDPDVTRWLATTRPMSAGDERRWLESLAQRADEVCLMIVARDGDRPVGTVGLHRVGGPNRSATLGIALGEKAHWNRGLGSEALGLMLAYGFDTLNLHRVELHVYASNARAQRVY
jgi:RimJ/RimL family protein N-acetyltransferase